MQFTDSHIHLQEYKTKDAQQIINDLQKLGFYKVVCASTSPKDWDEVSSIVKLAPKMIIPAFGMHPWYIDDCKNFSSLLTQKLKEFSYSWIGECGLDNLKAKNKADQETVFTVQINKAKEFNRPLNIHMLKAEEQMIKYLPAMPKKFMFHSFSGSKEFLFLAIKRGAYISLSKSNLKRKNHLDLIKNIPLNRLLLESDGPFLSSYEEIPYLAQTISSIININYEDLVLQINQNFEEFCRGE